jgi:hypothetical protein
VPRGRWLRSRESRRRGAAAWPAALALEDARHGPLPQRRSPDRHRPGHPPSRIPGDPPARAAGPSSRPGTLSPRKLPVKGAAACGLRVPSLRSGQTPDREPPRQDPAPIRRTGKNRGARNQAGRSNVQADMTRVCRFIAVAVATVSILVGCSGQPGPHQTVTGLLVRVGGPAPGSPVPLPGTVVARNTAGGQFTTTTGNNGRFQLSLPPGTYRLTGHSPQVMGGSHQELCCAARTIHVTMRRSLHNIWVICSIP